MGENADQPEVHRASSKRLFMCRWVLANAMGAAASLAICVAISEVLPDRSPPASLVPEMVAIAASFATVQWLVLRQRVPRAGWWLAASTVGGMTAWPLFLGVYWFAPVPFAHDQVSNISEAAVAMLQALPDAAELGAVGAVMGSVLLGVLQWLVLRKRVARAGWWVLANGVALTAGFTLVGTLFGGIPACVSLHRDGFNAGAQCWAPEMAALGCGGALYGWITGWVLARLLRRPLAPRILVTTGRVPNEATMGQNADPSEVHRASLERLFTRNWVLANAVGGVASLVICVAIPEVLLDQFSPLGPALQAVGIAASFATAQWLVLRQRLSRAGWWVLASTVGGITAWPIFVAVYWHSVGAYGADEELNVLLALFGVGLSLPAALLLATLCGLPGSALPGALQWLVLRKRVARAGWWLLANAGGLVAGFTLAGAMFGGIRKCVWLHDRGLAASSVCWAPEMAVLGCGSALYGWITGPVLARLLREPLAPKGNEAEA